MNSIEQIIKNESIEDIVSAFGIGLAYPSLDRMVSRYRFDAVANGELLRTYTKLFEEGILANGDGPVAIKGPNWKAPKFVTEKRYT
ncbi:immunity protein [Pseudomonas uvaldensis]|uniref:immunity protein n=1 Tax=Pseudomonas uvaldensis TaxID=2878385 RepID=UPI001E2EA1EE|nr:immunity protein [Pseudomonas uvaldensis]MCE0461298.1 immunity protein [Pseudomonas uvaldensis]